MQRVCKNMQGDTGISMRICGNMRRICTVCSEDVSQMPGASAWQQCALLRFYLSDMNQRLYRSTYACRIGLYCKVELVQQCSNTGESSQLQYRLYGLRSLRRLGCGQASSADLRPAPCLHPLSGLHVAALYTLYAYGFGSIRRVVFFRTAYTTQGTVCKIRSISPTI